MIDNLQAIFEKYEDDGHNFDAIETKFSNRADLHAFIMLDHLQPGGPIPGTHRIVERIIDAAEHDQIWLAIDCAKLAANITEEQVRDLLRCGVWYDEETDSLAMFR